MPLAKAVPLRKGPPTGGPRCPLAASARRVAERTARRWRPPACGRPLLARAGGACREREARQGWSGVERGRRPRGAGAGSPRRAARCLIGMRGARFHVRDVARGPGAGIARPTPQRSPTSRGPPNRPECAPQERGPAHHAGVDDPLSGRHLQETKRRQDNADNGFRSTPPASPNMLAILCRYPECGGGP